MKKLLLSGLALTLTLSVFAQNKQQSVQSKLSHDVTSKKMLNQKPSEKIIAPFGNINSTVAQSRTAMTEIIIGSTVYDNQSNYGTVGNRLKRWDDNTISAVFSTMSDDAPNYSNRGTGYNYNDGTSWGTAPAGRIETIRTGFPNIGGTSSSGEYVVNHGTNPTNFVSRPTKGTGAWSEAALGATTNMTWPRMVVGGANGNSVHVIGNENAGSFHVIYSRSLDGGATWVDENVVLPGEATDYFEGSVDGYDIDARGDVVAIVIGGFAEDLSLWKSTDNGANWTKTIINEFPLSPFDYTTMITDVDGDGVADTIPTTDSGISCVIDNNNMVHVSVGSMRVFSDAPNTTGASYFPGTDGLLYWNESMPAGNILNNVIASLEDRDGSGVIELADDIAIYQCSLSGMPSLGVDANNNIHLVYSALIENTTNANPDPTLAQSYRNVYYMNSADNGVTWSTPATVEQSDFDEMVYPSISKSVGACVNIIYQKDDEPGTSVGSDADPAHPNSIIYVCVPNPLLGVKEVDGISKINIYPNPASNYIQFDYNLEKAQSFNLQLVDILGKVVYSSVVNGVSGMNNITVDVKNISSGIYSLNTIVGNKTVSTKVVID